MYEGHYGRVVGQFDPVTLMASEDFTHQESRVAEACCGSARDRAIEGRHVECADILRTREHEGHHFSQFVTSSFGKAVYDLRRIRQEAFVHYADEVVLSRSVERLDHLLVPDFGVTPLVGGAPESDRARLAADVWRSSNIVLGSLWKKGMSSRQFADAVDVLNRVYSATPGARLLNLESRRPWEANIFPEGSMSIEIVVESAARFNELRGLLARYALADALDYWEARLTGVGGYGIQSVARTLGVHPASPVFGALLEMCLVTMPDPFGDKTFIWERDHAGLRLRSATAVLSRRSAADNGAITASNANAVAFDAIGEDADEVSQVYFDAATRAASSKWNAGSSSDFFGSPPEFFELGYARRGSQVLLTAGELVRQAPHLRPPGIVTPEGVLWSSSLSAEGRVGHFIRLCVATFVDELAARGTSTRVRRLLDWGRRAWSLDLDVLEVFERISSEELSGFVGERLRTGSQ